MQNAHKSRENLMEESMANFLKLTQEKKNDMKEE